MGRDQRIWWYLPTSRELSQPLIGLLTVPLAIAGIIAGLTMIGSAVNCIVIRGAPALIGLLIKKTNILIEKVDQRMRWPPVISLMQFWIVLRDVCGQYCFL